MSSMCMVAQKPSSESPVPLAQVYTENGSSGRFIDTGCGGTLATTAPVYSDRSHVDLPLSTTTAASVLFWGVYCKFHQATRGRQDKHTSQRVLAGFCVVACRASTAPKANYKTCNRELTPPYSTAHLFSRTPMVLSSTCDRPHTRSLLYSPAFRCTLCSLRCPRPPSGGSTLTLRLSRNPGMGLLLQG